MVLRRRKVDGHPFYGCPKFPRCSETAPHEDDDLAETVTPYDRPDSDYDD
jgi:hypothetical protein